VLEQRGIDRPKVVTSVGHAKDVGDGDSVFPDLERHPIASHAADEAAKPHPGGRQGRNLKDPGSRISRRVAATFAADACCGAG
jgi:hypothetical protein